MAGNNIDDALQKIVDYYTEKADADFITAMEHATDIMQQEAKNMYDAMIAQFYKYHTTSYIRHWEGKPGTEQGSNLYYAAKIGKNIKKKYSYGVPYLDIDINADGMAGGYQRATKEEVLDYVLTGTRFAYKNVRMSWSGKYIGKYFSCDGTIERAFSMFLDHYESIATPIFMDKWRTLGWK